jgi:dihydroorotase
MKLHIKGGRLIDPRSGVDAKKDVFIAAGKVVALGQPPNGFAANRVIDASGLIVCPGLVDLSARLREPGFEYLATLESEMAAAIAGGVTSLACPPDTDPPLDEPGLVEMLKYRAQSLNQARVYPVGALTQGLKGERLTEMAELVDAAVWRFRRPTPRSRTTRSSTTRCNTRRPSAFRSGCARRTPRSRGTASPTTGRSRPAAGCRAYRCARRPWRSQPC